MALFSQLRFALRSFRKTPGFVLVAISTLGLAIGANTAMFTILENVFIRW